MKYYCKICNSDYCFDGSTDESLPNDIKQHESGETHKRHVSDLWFYEETEFE